jgi:hypothetical protein
MIFKTIFLIFFTLSSHIALASSEPPPPQEIRVIGEMGYLAYIKIEKMTYRITDNDIFCDFKVIEESYLPLGQTRVFHINDPTPASSDKNPTYNVHVQGLNFVTWFNPHNIFITKSEITKSGGRVCIKLYGSLYNPNYAKVNCGTKL